MNMFGHAELKYERNVSFYVVEILFSIDVANDDILLLLYVRYSAINCTLCLTSSHF